MSVFHHYFILWSEEFLMMDMGYTDCMCSRGWTAFCAGVWLSCDCGNKHQALMSEDPTSFLGGLGRLTSLSPAFACLSDHVVAGYHGQ